MSDMEIQNDEALWEVEDVAGYLKVSERTVQRKVSDKAIPFVRIGRFVRFRPEAIREWAAAQEIDPQDPKSAVTDAALDPAA